MECCIIYVYDSPRDNILSARDRSFDSNFSAIRRRHLKISLDWSLEVK